MVSFAKAKAQGRARSLLNSKISSEAKVVTSWSAMANLLGTFTMRPDLVFLRRSGLIYGSEELSERGEGGGEAEEGEKASWED